MKYNNGLMNDCMPALKFLSDCFLVVSFFSPFARAVCVFFLSPFGISNIQIKNINIGTSPVIESRFTENFFVVRFIFMSFPLFSLPWYFSLNI